MTNFPPKIAFKTDGNEAKFVREIVGAKVKERVADYEFTKSETNLGVNFSLFLAQIEKGVNDGFFEIK